VVLIRQLTLTTDLDLSENAEFPVESVEDKIDRAFAALQQMQEQFDRTIKWDITSGTTGVSAEDPTAELFLRMSSDNTRIEFVVGTGEISPPVNSTDNAIARWDGTGGTALQDSGVLIDDSDNVTGVNDITVGGNLTVSGTTTTLDTLTTDIKDPNATLNKGGNQAAADTIAGITVEMSDATNVSVLYDSTAATRWKVGDVASEVEVVDISTAQTLTNKTIDSDNNVITNIVDADIKAAAGIDATKIGGGLVSSTEFDFLNNVGSDVVGKDDAVALTAKTSIAVDNLLLDGNTISSTDTDGDISLSPDGTGRVDVNTSIIENVTDPTDPQHAATKAYADSLVTGPADLDVETFSSVDTLDSANDFAQCNASSAGFTLNLPTAVGITGKRYWIYKTDSTFNQVTIDPDGAETINGLSTITLNTEDEAVELLSTGTGWLLVRRDIPARINSYTPVGTWSTNTTYTGKWERNGHNIFVRIAVETSGAPDAVTLDEISLPTGLTIDTAALPITNTAQPIGNVVIVDGGATIWEGTSFLSATADKLRPTVDLAASTLGFPTNTIPMTWANTDKMMLTATVPITNWAP